MRTQSPTRTRRVFGRPPPEVKVKPLPRFVRPAFAHLLPEKARADALGDLHARASRESWSSERKTAAIALIGAIDFM